MTSEQQLPGQAKVINDYIDFQNNASKKWLCGK